MSASGRYCCKSPKLPGDNFPAIRRSDRRPPICVVSITLPRSPVSLSSGDEVPHIFTRKSRLQPGEFLISSAKRLLQQNLPLADKSTAANEPARRRGGPARKTSRAGPARILLLRRQIRLRDHRTIDDRLGRPQTADIRIAWPRRIDRGAGEQPFADQGLLLVHRVDAMDLSGVDGCWRPHADMRIP